MTEHGTKVIDIAKVNNNENETTKKETYWLRKLFNDFAGNTTAHGFGQIAFTNLLIVKAFWIFVLIACHVFLYFQVRPLIERYLDKPTSTKIFHKREKNPSFPVFVICNQNMVKLDKYDELWDLVKAGMSGSNITTKAPFTTTKDTRSVETVEAETVVSNETNYFGWGETTNSIRIEEDRVKERMNAYVSFHAALAETAQAIGDEIHKFGHQIQELIQSCNWKVLNDCKSTDYWNRFWHWKYGSCYAFNSGYYQNGSRSKIVNVSRAGPGNGLEIKLFINQSQYSTTRSDTAGARFFVGDQGTLYSPHKNGQSLSPGFAYSIGLRKKLIDPFMNQSCVKHKSYLLNIKVGQKHLRKYSSELCGKQCLAETQRDECGCISYYLPQVGLNTTTCRWKDRSCVDNIDR